MQAPSLEGWGKIPLRIFSLQESDIGQGTLFDEQANQMNRRAKLAYASDGQRANCMEMSTKYM